MNKICFPYLILALLIWSCLIGNVFGYDDEITHGDITRQSIEKSQLDGYLINNLGLIDGIETAFLSNSEHTIRKLLYDGSGEEDAPACRATNHFHNPIEPSWGQSYMSDDNTGFALKIRNLCNAEGWLFENRKSNITWATGYLTQPPYGEKANFGDDILKHPFSWDLARDYFYRALTTASSESSTLDSTRWYTATFKTLGHVLHLLQDVGVPAHVRNDFASHLIWDGPKWEAFDKWIIQPYEHYVKTNPELVKTSLPDPDKDADLPRPSFSNKRLTDFWDTNQYTGVNPPPSDTRTFGLSESTNANYFTVSTMPSQETTSEHSFPHPKLTTADHQLCGELVTVIFGEAGPHTLPRKYISRKSLGPCPETPNVSADNWLAVSLLNEEDLINDDSIILLRTTLDTNVYDTYAKELLPRAVGYSAGLLDYFFRGDIDMEPDPNGNGYIIINNGDEEMSGTFALYYDDINGTRHKVDGAEWELTIDSKAGDIPGESPLVTFTHPTSPAPEKPGMYMLVFQGWMGNEEGAVAGKLTSLLLPVVVIKLEGKLYSPAGFVQNGSSPLYLLWDVRNSKQLTVNKTGGGIWTYPLTDEEYNGQFLTDLETMYGGGISISSTSRLLSRDLDGKISTNIRKTTANTPAYIPDGALAQYREQNWLWWPDCISECTYYHGTDEAIIQKLMDETNGSRDLNFSHMNREATNSIGIVDTWSETAETTISYINTMGFDIYREDHDPGAGDACVRREGPGRFGNTFSGVRTLSFRAHSSVSPILHLGFPSGCIYPDNNFDLDIGDGTCTGFCCTLLPPPTSMDSAILTTLNASRSEKVFAPTIDYSGMLTFSETMSIVLFADNDKCFPGARETTVSSSTTATGAGTVTSALGGYAEVSYAYSENASPLTKTPVFSNDDFIWFPDYSGSRSVDYANTSLDVSSALDLIDNLQAVIIIETFENGKGYLELIPPVPPLSFTSSATESEVIYSNRQTSYDIKVICEIVEDAYAQDPWLLPNNTILETELDGMIDAYIAENPPGGDNHWNFSTTIKKIMW